MLPPAVAAAVLFAFGHPVAGAVAAVLAILLLLFFRDPGSHYEGADDVVLAPAWGKVLRIETAQDPAVSPEPLHRIVTFLSVFDVHLQRAPISGRIVHSAGNPGRRVAAFRHDAGEVNAGRLTVLEGGAGDRVGVRQIVGLLARRIVCYFQVGQRVRARRDPRAHQVRLARRSDGAAELRAPGRAGGAPARRHHAGGARATARSRTPP